MMIGNSCATELPGSKHIIVGLDPAAQRRRPNRNRPPRVNGAGFNVGWLPALALLSYCMLFALLRHIPGVALGVAVVIALILVSQSRRLHDKYIFPLLGVSILYLFLSYIHALPSAWTTYWEPSFILRQWMWVPLLALFSSSFCYVFIRFHGLLIRYAWQLLVAAFVIGRLSLYFSPLDISLSVKLTIYTLIPENAVFMMMLSICIFYKMRRNLASFMVLIALTPIFTSAQSLILFFSILAVRFIGVGRAIVGAIAAGLVCAALLAPHYIPELYKVDSSSGFRATLWRDAGDAFLQSNMIGVGFGTESFRNVFMLPEQSGWTVTSEDSENRLLIGAHNTGYDIAARMGIPGLIAFLFWIIGIVGCTRSTLSTKNREAMMNCTVFLALLINNGFNMGVTSINFMFCTAICSGWLIASRQRMMLAQ